ncbi:unnamed protein product [Zymoseptoria tritici ST99CH_1A5]|uniref:Uncharacterized protein n=1 Tax=Zymoseptoria tritici ST99CH_1A5 TaxID=1276529 RepID=A0A1Y6LV97_ZYMTR|nr:unnamed protein product [Zymoseptoria tritici ST99CH_1A5]
MTTTMARRMRSPSLVVAGHLRRSAERTEAQRGVSGNSMARGIMTPTAPRARRARNSDRQCIAEKSKQLSKSDHKRKPGRPAWYDEDDDEEPSSKRIKREASESDMSMPLQQEAKTSGGAASTDCWLEAAPKDFGCKLKHHTAYDARKVNEDWDELPSYDEAQHSARVGSDGSFDGVNTMELHKEAELIDRRLEILKQLREHRKGV